MSAQRAFVVGRELPSALRAFAIGIGAHVSSSTFGVGGCALSRARQVLDAASPWTVLHAKPS